VLQLALDRKEARLEVQSPSGALDWRTLDLTQVRSEEVEGDLLARLGLRLYRPDVPPTIGQVVAGSVAERAGLVARDRVLTVDGQAIATWEALVTKVRGSAGRTLELEVDRTGQRLRIHVTPEPVAQGAETIGRIGAGPYLEPGAMSAYLVEVRYGPGESLTRALAKTWEMSVFSLRMLGKMIVGEISWRNLSGPVTIADYAGQSAQLGLVPYLAFLALISISLGVLNLLPIPLLDGGHLMYYTIEVLKGSPVSERVMELGQRAGLVVLLFLMAFAFYNDINRLVSG
jgi:regulator of sigma E protease